MEMACHDRTLNTFWLNFDTFLKKLIKLIKLWSPKIQISLCQQMELQASLNIEWREDMF